MESSCYTRTWLYLFSFFLITLICSPVSAKTIYVDDAGGSDTYDGLTWSTAKKTVNTGLTTAVAGDDVWVAEGTYSGRLQLKAGVRMYGGFPSGGGDLNTRNFALHRTLIDGQGIGTAIQVASGATTDTRIDGFTIRNSGYALNGVISCSGASPTIVNNSIMGNGGSGVYCYYGSTAVIANNLICRNNGAGIYCESSSPTITNNTIVANSAVRTGAGQGTGVCCYDSAAMIVNNIICLNASGIYVSTTTGSRPTLRNNCVYNPDGYNYSGTSAGVGDISMDPKIVPLGPAALHIQPDSPCVDAGDDNAIQAGWLDIDAQPRVYGAHVDIGADESDGSTWNMNPIIVRVSPTGNDLNDGSSWSSTKQSVQAAIDAASVEGGQVWVSTGVYPERIFLRDGVYVYGGFAGDETTLEGRDWNTNTSSLDGGKGDYVVTIPGGMLLGTGVDGFTIRGGSANTYGVYCTGGSPLIAHNRVCANDGSGIYCQSSSPVITGNVVSANGQTGVYLGANCSAKVVGNTVVGNSGSGMYFSSSTPVVSGNIVAFNGAGIQRYSGVPVLGYNCVYGNLAYDYTGITDPTGTNGNLSADPKLEAVGYGRVHIQPDSPCIDAGDDSAVQAGWTDMDGQPRVQGAHVDIGADESDGATWTFTPAVVRVSPTGDDANHGSSWEKAMKTVQAAIDTVSARGGEVWVKAGTYHERLAVASYVHLYGGFAGSETNLSQRDWRANRTVIDADAGGAVASFANTGFRTNAIDGFTIRNSGAFMPGVHVTDSSPTIANDTITNNAGAGISCYTGSPLISNNLITRNVLLTPGTATTGAGIYCNTSSALIANNIISGNSGSYYGSGIYCDRASPTVVNNTIVANSGPGADGAGIYCQYSPSTKVLNNIIAFNPSGVVGTPTDSSFRNNCVYGNTLGNYRVSAEPTGTNGNISVDPKLESAQYGKAHIQPDSPCIDAGDDTGIETGWMDIDGQARLQGVHTDIGADESDGTIWSFSPVVLRVATSGDDANDGSSWAKAKRSIQAAVDAVSAEGGEVWAAAGIYDEHLVVGPYTYLYGGFAGDELSRSQRDWTTNASVIDGRGGGPVVKVTGGHRASTIDGFTITNGEGRSGNGIACSYTGVTVANNRIVGNCAATGGGITCEYACPLITGNVIAANSATETSGGGIYSDFYSHPSIMNNTIVGNNAPPSNAGAGIMGSPSSVIVNNIIAFNSSGVTGLSTTTVFRNNCVYGNSEGNYQYPPDQTGTNGNISVDPRLEAVAYGKVHIQPDSPCLDTGDDSVAEAAWVDMDGQPRIYGAHVDIGADESDGTSWSFAPTAVRVSPTGDDASDGSSWNTAKKTIQAGVDAACLVGAEVWVAGATYHESINLRPYAYLYGGFDGSEVRRSERNPRSNVTVVDGTSTPAVAVNCGHSASGINGFVIRNDNGDGIMCRYSSPTVSNNNISGNAGSGVGCYHGLPDVRNNIISANGLNGVVFASASPTLTGNTIIGNCSFGVTVDSSGGSYGAASAFGNIVAFNELGVQGFTFDQAHFRNNCVYGNKTSNYKSLSDPTGTYGNISADPKLEAVSYGRVHIQPDSPCIDAGDDSAVQAGWTDMDGQPRVQGAHVDIGADESDGATWTFTPAVVRVSPTGDDANDGSSWEKAMKTVQAGIDAVSTRGGEVWVRAGLYPERVFLRPFCYLLGGFSGTEVSADGRDWRANASVIEADGLGDVVTVKGGLDASRIDGFTIRNQGTYFSGVLCSNASPTIANNLITGNKSSGVYCLNSAALVIGNTVTGNGATYGAGVRCQNGRPTVNYNIIRGNNADWDGGGIYSFRSTAVISNNLICGNTAGFGGGGLYLDDTNSTRQCTITNNTIASNSQGIYVGAGATIANNIVAFNSFGLEKNTVNTVTLRNNCVYNSSGYNYNNLSAGVGDISEDPMLGGLSIGDYHLTTGSPCIDTGWSLAPGLTEFDIEGQRRIMGGAVDIGADEYGPVTTIQEAKRLRAGAPVTLSPLVASAVFPDFFYVETDNRSSGIRVDKTAHGITPGTRTSVIGSVNVNADGECFVQASSLSTVGTGAVRPLGVSLRTLGSGAFGLQEATWSWKPVRQPDNTWKNEWTADGGLSNIGLLVKVWGDFTYVDAHTFTIDDGSGMVVTCIVPDGVTLDPSWNFADVTGVSSCERAGDGLPGLTRLIRVRVQTDILPL